tara:strand:- start:311 stop:712 length:402 start_codon:yes stop_codon:yes gene_type:complete
MSLLIVPSTHIDYAWNEDGASSLAESCTVDEITPDQLKMILSRGERNLVQIKTGDAIGWGVYRIDQLPNLRVLHITNLVAHNASFEDFFKDMKSIAKTYGCSSIRCSCSSIHARLYKMKCGFTSVYETIEVKI